MPRSTGASPGEQIDRLIRGCNPAPGAWTTLDGKTLKIFDAKPLPAKDPKGIAGKLGEIVAVDADGFTVVCADGRFKVTRVQPDGGKKIAPANSPVDCQARYGRKVHVISTKTRSRNRRFTALALNGTHPCPPRSISQSEIRHRNFADRQEAADHRHRARRSSASRRRTSSPTATTRPRCRWITSSRSRTRRTAS